MDGQMTDEIQKWYDNLMGALEDGDLSDREAEMLRKQYADIAEQGQKRAEALSKATGLDFETDKSGSLIGRGIEAVTEESALEFSTIIKNI